MNNTISNTISEDRRGNLSTADLAASADSRERRTGDESLPGDKPPDSTAAHEPEAALAPLFDQGTAQKFRNRWGVVQQGFVDDPPQAVREGDELVAQVIKNLAETFAQQRATIEGEQGSTEDLRLALRRYRSFFDRLLAI